MLPGAKCAPPVTPTPGFAFLSLPAGPLTSSACHPLAPPIVWPSQLIAPCEMAFPSSPVSPQCTWRCSIFPQWRKVPAALMALPLSSDHKFPPQRPGRTPGVGRGVGAGARAPLVS